MSADNGFIIQINSNGQYTLQGYSASADELPNPDQPGRVFETLEDAAIAYAKMAELDDFVCEYGLSFNLKQPPQLPPLEKDDLVVIKGELNPQGHPYRIGRVRFTQLPAYPCVNVQWYSGKSAIRQTHRRVNLQKVGHWSPE